jgi:hypothetical protein
MLAPNGGHSSWRNTSHKAANVLKLLTYIFVHYFLPKLHFLVVKYNLIFIDNNMIESKINNKNTKKFKFSLMYCENPESPSRNTPLMQALTKTHGITERCCRGCSTLASPLAGIVFSSLSGDKFNYLKCNLVFIGPSRQALRQQLKRGH